MEFLIGLAKTEITVHLVMQPPKIVQKTITIAANWFKFCGNDNGFNPSGTPSGKLQGKSQQEKICDLPTIQRSFRYPLLTTSGKNSVKLLGNQSTYLQFASWYANIRLKKKTRITILINKIKFLVSNLLQEQIILEQPWLQDPATLVYVLRECIHFEKKIGYENVPRKTPLTDLFRRRGFWGTEDKGTVNDIFIIRSPKMSAE